MRWPEESDIYLTSNPFGFMNRALGWANVRFFNYQFLFFQHIHF